MKKLTCEELELLSGDEFLFALEYEQQQLGHDSLIDEYSSEEIAVSLCAIEEKIGRRLA